jgi:hypothetical protein
LHPVIKLSVKPKKFRRCFKKIGKKDEKIESSTIISKTDQST